MKHRVLLVLKDEQKELKLTPIMHEENPKTAPQGIKSIEANKE